MIDITRRRLPYVLMDVFTDRALEGNQLAIFPDARGLTTELMQAIARETNLSETTFIFPRELEEERSKGTRVRIFTTQEELPFAGHPTLGTSYFLHRFGGNDEIWLDLNAGKIPVHFHREQSGRSFGEMRQRDPEAGKVHNKAEVAHATGLSLNEIVAELPVQTFSTGLPFTIVPVTSLAAVRKAGPWSRMAEYLERTNGRSSTLSRKKRLLPTRSCTRACPSTTATILRPDLLQDVALHGWRCMVCLRAASRRLSSKASKCTVRVASMCEQRRRVTK